MTTEDSGKYKNKKVDCNLKLVVNEDKIKEDVIWDGLKGVITKNMEIPNEELIYQYNNL